MRFIGCRNYSPTVGGAVEGEIGAVGGVVEGAVGVKFLELGSRDAVDAMNWPNLLHIIAACVIDDKLAGAQRWVIAELANRMP